MPRDGRRCARENSDADETMAQQVAGGVVDTAQDHARPVGAVRSRPSRFSLDYAAARSGCGHGRPPDGQIRVEVTERRFNDNDTLRAFADAVLAAEPKCHRRAGVDPEIRRHIVRAFIHAGLWALLSISILLWIALRRVSDVLLTLVPLLSPAR